MGRGFILAGGVAVRFFGPRIWGAANAYRDDGAVIADLRLGLERGRIGVSVFAENVADTRRNEVFVGLPESGRANAVANPDRRRFVGGTIEARF